LWSTEVQAKDFDLQAFTTGEHNKAAGREKKLLEKPPL